MLTGTIPPYHGVHNNIGYQLAQSNITLPEILKQNGFNTAAIVSAFVLDKRLGLSQGFDTYDDTFKKVQRNTHDNERTGDETTQDWLKDIMALHYGVLLYRNRLEPDGTAPQIIARGQFLEQLAKDRADLAETTNVRLEGNRRFQALLQNPDEIEKHLDATRSLVDRMISALSGQPYMAGERYSLADCFATAALARFTIHKLGDWWADTPLDDYYTQMKARPSFAVADVVDTGTERDL